jgi:2-(1,2-epoxy-1,2-dihydrophenyl)acetyl-CoA isomerase
VAEAPVLLEISGGVGRLTLNRPGNANAIDVATARALAESAGKLAGDPTVRAVLLRGAGERFCGGGDVKSFADARDGLDARLREIVTQLHVAMDALASLDAPVVAAVQGSAAGAGFALALAADLVLAAESARFVLAYTGIGLTPDGGTTWYLERTVGRRRALELVLTNRALSAAEALDWGLVTRVVPDEDLGATAEELVGELATGPTRAFGAAKRLVDAAPRAELDAQLAAEAAALTRAGASSDGVEGVRAFTEKRRPSFRGD